MTVEIRAARPGDEAGLWRILGPIIRAGETYSIPRDLPREDALKFWLGPNKSTFVAVDGDELLGTYYLMRNKEGGGSHVCNCGYMTGEWARGRGIARLMGQHSQVIARSEGFRAMQYNLVVSTNKVAIRLWQQLGFDIVGTLPGAFNHPALGDVDAHIMYKRL
ncbi:MAG: GNAT family N-acetyltransferase [Pseudomonadota bacterium]